MPKYDLSDFKSWLKNRPKSINTNSEVWIDFFKYAFSNGELIRKHGGNVNYWCSEVGLKGKYSKKEEQLCFELLVDWMNYEIDREKERQEVLVRQEQRERERERETKHYGKRPRLTK